MRRAWTSAGDGAGAAVPAAGACCAKTEAARMRKQPAKPMQRVIVVAPCSDRVEGSRRRMFAVRTRIIPISLRADAEIGPQLLLFEHRLRRRLPAGERRDDAR